MSFHFLDAPHTNVPPQNFVGDLDCAEDTADISDVVQYIDDALESLTGSSLNDLEAEDGASFSIGAYIKETLTKMMEDSIPDHIDYLVPQRVCSGKGDNLPTRGPKSCGKLDMVSLHISMN